MLEQAVLALEQFHVAERLTHAVVDQPVVVGDGAERG